MTRAFIDPRGEPLVTLEAGTDGAIRLVSKRDGLQNATVLFSSTSVPVGGYEVTFVYVDSVAGSNANSGLTAAAPKQTLAAAKALLANGYALMLKRGSTWYEELSLTALGSVTIAAYGTGAAPIIDGSAEIPETWTQPDAGTYPNVWSVAHTHTFSTNQIQLPVMKNGVQMLRKTSIADVNATAGTYYSPHDELLATNNPATLYIHATSNPNSDGNVYSVPARPYCITNAFGASSGVIVFGVQTQSQGHNDGSAVFSDNSNINRSLFRNGHKHNALIGSGTMTDCAVVETTDAGGIAVVLYATDGAGKSGVFKRLLCMGRIGQTAVISGPAFYSHTDGFYHDSITIEQGYFKGYAAALTGIAGAGNFDGCYIRNSTYFGLNTPVTTIRYMLTRVDAFGSNAAVFETVGTHSLANCAFYSGISGQEHIRLTLANTNVTFTNCSLYDGGGRSLVTGFSGVGTSPITLNRCVFWGSAQLPATFDSSPTLTSNYNVWYKAENFGSTTPSMTYGGVTHASLGAWQTATGQDANSVYCRPVDQVAGGANAFWLAWSTAPALTDLGTIGPAVGDFRINPNARVYTSAEVAYIGTFADGTLLTTAGQQMHWDWNTRAAVAGPNQAWPIVPETVANAQTYIANPVAWVF